MNTENESKIFILEYIWLDGNSEFRSKTRVVYETVNSIMDVPIWNYDGSSTGQADTHNSEIFLHPMVLFNDPFRKKYTEDKIKCLLVWCETKNSVNIPLYNSNRSKALDIFKQYEIYAPWFGLEQEYVILMRTNNKPYHFSNNINTNNNSESYPKQGKYYCGVGINNVPDRDIVETHLRYCIYAGIKICGINAEVAPGQWEYQIGPCEGIDAGDHLWVSRYILNRVAEDYGCLITYHPKPLIDIGSHWNGSGCHTNFSTKSMREDGGIEEIMNAVNKLESKHELHISCYGENNDLRLTGENETASILKFSYGVGSRTTSIRIPNTVVKEGKGYFEDRRPASNCDPYLVTMLITETCCKDDIEISKENVPEIKNNVVIPIQYQNIEILHHSHFC